LAAVPDPDPDPDWFTETAVFIALAFKVVPERDLFLHFL
jgi:hypothetical protein